MNSIPSEAYTLFGAIIGASITLCTTWLAQRSQRNLEHERLREGRAQLLFKEKAERVYQFATDLGAAAYAFVSITWNAQHAVLDAEAKEDYFADIKEIMPRLYAGYVQLAALDDELGKVAESLVDQADQLDVAIAEATVAVDQVDPQKLRSLREGAEKFADAVSKSLAEEMKRKRLGPPSV